MKTDRQRIATILQAGKADLPYAAENVKRFLAEVIYGDRNRRNVLRDYVEFIANCKME